jgi:hypothetical protein
MLKRRSVAGVRTAIVLVMLGTVALATGCTVADPQPAPEPDLVIVTSGETSLSGMQALISLSLEAAADGCVYGHVESGDQVTLVWPKGYTVRGDSASFDVLDAGGSPVVTSGDIVSLGGGGVSAVTAAGGAHCIDDQIWVVGEIG